MPCIKCNNGKYRLGSSDCMYTTLESCKAAERAYFASKNPAPHKKTLDPCVECKPCIDCKDTKE